MADVRKLLARLNPGTIRYDIGRGGEPELTNIDIAGALGFVKNKFGREVMEACWWPEGAILRWRELRAVVLAVVEPELARQTRIVQKARVDLQIAESNALWAGRSGRCDTSNIAACRQRLECARAECWPMNTVEKLPLVVATAIAEIRGLQCDECAGTGNVVASSLVVKCHACKGSGWSQVTDRWRADKIEVDPSDYPKRWRRVYEWVYEQMRNAEADAAHELGRIVFDGGS